VPDLPIGWSDREAASSLGLRRESMIGIKAASLVGGEGPRRPASSFDAILRAQ